MTRVVVIDDETGERRELQGSRVVLLVGEGDELEMVQCGDAQDSEVTCDMLIDAHEKAQEPAPLSSTVPPRIALH